MDCSVTVLHCVVYMEEEKRMKLIAPIAKSQHMREIWKLPCCELIEKSKFHEAYIRYKNYTMKLVEKYL